MICFIHYNKALPKERLSLYEDCSKLLLEQWDLEKGLPQDDIPLNLARKDIIMQEIAFALHSGQIGVELERKEATYNEILFILQNVLERLKLQPTIAPLLFDKLVKRTGLIVPTEKYKELYSFSHLTFQEYYTAKYLHSNRIDVFTVMTTNDMQNIQQLDSWWREVILLYSAMQKDSTNIINQLLEPDTRDLLQLKLRIAAQCYTEAIEKPSQDVEYVLFDDLFKIRSQRQRNGSSEKFLPEAKDYLLNYAVRKQFFNNTLQSNLRNNDKEDAFLKSQVQLFINSPNSEIQFATFYAIENESVYQSYITEEVIVDLLSQVGYKEQLLVLNFVINHYQEPLPQEYAQKIVEQVLKPLIDDLKPISYRRKYHNRIIDDLEIRCLLVDLFAHQVFKFVRELILKWVVIMLRNVLENEKAYSSWHYITSFENYILTFAKLLHTDIEFCVDYGKQLMNILRTGSPYQQSVALLLLSELPNVSQQTELIASKLRYSSSKVRIAALRLLPMLQLNHTLHQKVIEELNNYIIQPSFIVLNLHKFDEILTGKGALGNTLIERVQIASCLYRMGEPDELTVLVNNNELKLSGMLCREFLIAFYDLFPILDEGLVEKFVLKFLNERSIVYRWEFLRGLFIVYGEDIQTRMKITKIAISQVAQDPNLLRILNPSDLQIDKDDLIYQQVIDCLQSNDFRIADSAYNILLQNNLM